MAGPSGADHSIPRQAAWTHAPTSENAFAQSAALLRGLSGHIRDEVEIALVFPGNEESHVPAEHFRVGVARGGPDVAQGNAVARLGRAIEAPGVDGRRAVQRELPRQELQVNQLRVDPPAALRGTHAEASVLPVAHRQRYEGRDPVPPVHRREPAKVAVGVLVPAHPHGRLLGLPWRPRQELRIVEIHVLGAEDLCDSVNDLRVPRQVPQPGQPDVVHGVGATVTEQAAVLLLEALEAGEGGAHLLGRQGVHGRGEAIQLVAAADFRTRLDGLS
mmetsp:Transcript_108517/g.324492  ORF Transcript_108517/g.324492 Transcript_108517/m.324492 type:complete len:274 (-) Transcript_108517:397-1218(-)